MDMTSLVELLNVLLQNRMNQNAVWMFWCCWGQTVIFSMYLIHYWAAIVLNWQHIHHVEKHIKLTNYKLNLIALLQNKLQCKAIVPDINLQPKTKADDILLWLWHHMHEWNSGPCPYGQLSSHCCQFWIINYLL